MKSLFKQDFEDYEELAEFFQLQLEGDLTKPSFFFFRELALQKLKICQITFFTDL